MTRCGVCNQKVSEEEAEGPGCVCCTGGCGVKCHTECARWDLAARVAAEAASSAQSTPTTDDAASPEDTPARQGPGGHARARAPVPARPTQADAAEEDEGEEAEEEVSGLAHELNGSYWSAASRGRRGAGRSYDEHLAATAAVAAAKAAEAEAAASRAAAVAAAGRRAPPPPVPARPVVGKASGLQQSPYTAWRCARCASLLGHAVYAKGQDGFYHRGEAVARDEHGQMQAPRPAPSCTPSSTTTTC